MERLKRGRSLSAARALVAEAHLAITKARLAGPARERFWQALEESLDSLREEARFLADRRAGVTLAERVVAARALAVRHRASTMEGSAAGDS